MAAHREFDPAFQADLAALLETRNEGLLRSLLAQLHPADLADALEHVDAGERAYVFSLIAGENRSQAMVEMEAGAREGLLQELDAEAIVPIVEELSADDAADLVQTLPDTRKPPLPSTVDPGGHGGSQGYLGHEFVMSIVEARKPLIDVAWGLNMSVPGAIAHQSALKNGELMKIPQYKL